MFAKPSEITWDIPQKTPSHPFPASDWNCMGLAVPTGLVLEVAGEETPSKGAALLGVR